MMKRKFLRILAAYYEYPTNAEARALARGLTDEELKDFREVTENLAYVAQYETQRRNLPGRQ